MKQSKNSTQQVMYIGPNVQRLGLLRNEVYIDGIPGQVRAAIMEIPEIEQLIVPIDGLPDSINKTRTKGEHLHHVYNLVAQKAAKR